MRVALLNLTSGGISGGYRKYLVEMLPRLDAHPGIEAMLVASPAGVSLDEWVPSLHKTVLKPCRPFRVLHHVPDRDLANDLDLFKPDVLFVPIARFVRYRHLPVVVMVQNMWPLVSRIDDRTLFQSHVYLAERMETRIALKNAAHIIAISDFVKDTLTTRWSVAEERLTRAYFGVNPEKAGSARRPAAIPEGETGRFIFTAGSIAPFRGLTEVISAIKLLVKDEAAPFIVIAGEARRDTLSYENRLKKTVIQEGLSSHVCFIGSLTEEEMAWCYRNCRCFIMSSRFEACPNIALEAMAHSCLAVSSDSSPMPEFFKDAALYYRGGDLRSLAAALSKALTINEEERDKFRRKARERSLDFCWDRTAELTVEVFKAAAAQVREKEKKSTRIPILDLD